MGSESVCVDGPNDLTNANESGNERQMVDDEIGVVFDTKNLFDASSKESDAEECKYGTVDDTTCSEDADTEECNNCNVDDVDNANCGEDVDAEECNSRNVDDVDDTNCGEDSDTKECNNPHVDDVDDTNCSEDDNE